MSFKISVYGNLYLAYIKVLSVHRWQTP